MAVIDKLTKKTIYPSKHKWAVKANKQLSDRIKVKTFGITLGRTTQSTTQFKGYQLSKVLTNNIIINITNLSNNNIICSVKGTVDDINKTFVHQFNDQYNVDPTLRVTAFKKLFEIVLLKPNVTDNQLAQLISAEKYKTTTLYDGLSLADIANCRNRARKANQMFKLSTSQYTVDDQLQKQFKMTGVDFVLVNKSYRSKQDQYNTDKKTISDKRYSSQSNKIISTVIDYRLKNKQIIPIKLDESVNIPTVWDKARKTKIANYFPTHEVQHEISYVDWSANMLKATIMINDNFNITITPETINIRQLNTSKNYSYTAFKSFLTADSTAGWPNTFKDDTTRVKTILDGYNTINKVNGISKQSRDIETIYQELSENDQVSAVNVMKTVQRVIDTFAVDNPSIWLYYLIDRYPNQLNYKYILV